MLMLERKLMDRDTETEEITMKIDLQGIAESPKDLTLKAINQLTRNLAEEYKDRTEERKQAALEILHITAKNLVSE
ncbi:hypothetical protein WMO40_21140 [Bacillaceae bacterium CLA-AA-H227]|uniref:Uncharacterized protein n=1 Tax=Robertmurraya yapensis (ex Hitch et al 2024) TaxID=3133160 RepID=A0ACC6SGL6_9BACI